MIERRGTTDEELAWLTEQAARFDTVLEVGTWLGASAEALGQGCRGTVWTVDHFRGTPSEPDTVETAGARHMHAEALNNLAMYPNVRVLPQSSLNASRQFGADALDMVFIDAEHTLEAVLIDLVLWAPKCHHLLCGHDRDMDSVLRALAIYGIAWEIGPGSIWFVERIK